MMVVVNSLYFFFQLVEPPRPLTRSLRRPCASLRGPCFKHKGARQGETGLCNPSQNRVRANIRAKNHVRANICLFHLRVPLRGDLREPCASLRGCSFSKRLTPNLTPTLRGCSFYLRGHSVQNKGPNMSANVLIVFLLGPLQRRPYI